MSHNQIIHRTRVPRAGYLFVREKNMNKLTKVIGILCLVALAGCGESREISLSERYPGPWREDFNMGITKTLASNNVGGCGQYKYRESIKDRGEYLVYCTRDGSNWVAYLVWPNIGKLTGPHTPDTSLK